MEVSKTAILPANMGAKGNARCGKNVRAHRCAGGFSVAARHRKNVRKLRADLPQKLRAGIDTLCKLLRAQKLTVSKRNSVRIHHYVEGIQRGYANGFPQLHLDA